ncbi:MAG: spore germination protein [Solirubrobacterales bacterium]
MISKSLNINEAYVRNVIGESFDIKYRPIRIAACNDAEGLIVYIASLVDTRVVDETILRPLMQCEGMSGKKSLTGPKGTVAAIMKQSVFTSSARESADWEDICDAITVGDTVLFIDQCASALILTTRKYEGRAVDQPDAESEVKGPRDGFVENIQTNAALIRRRIKDYGLRFDTIRLGERTKTVIAVVYIQDLASEALVTEVKQRLSGINLDAILATESIQELIEDNPLSIFPKTLNTERPDKAAAALLEGRVLIMVDNTPFVLILPAIFWEFFESSGDYYDRVIIATVIRWIRCLAVFLSTSATSIYVLLTSFHQEMLPTNLALKIATARSTVPVPAVIEAFAMEIILEIMKEASLRMPKAIGPTVSIVGTLVIGQAAVAAGLISPLMVITIAVAAISGFAIPSYSMSNSIRVIRFPILFLSASFGLYGYLAGVAAVVMYLMSLRSYGTPYLAPVIPYDGRAMKDLVVRAPWGEMTSRPGFVNAQDPIRVGKRRAYPVRNKNKS